MPAEENEKRGKPIRRSDGLVEVVDGNEGGHAHAAAHDGLHNAYRRVRKCNKRERASANVSRDTQEPLLVSEVGGDGSK